MPLNKNSFKSSQCLPNIRDNSVTSNNSGKKQDTKALCLCIFNTCSSTILHHLVIDIFGFSSKNTDRYLCDSFIDKKVCQLERLLTKMFIFKIFVKCRQNFSVNQNAFLKKFVPSDDLLQVRITLEGDEKHLIFSTFSCSHNSSNTTIGNPNATSNAEKRF